MHDARTTSHDHCCKRSRLPAPRTSSSSHAANAQHVRGLLAIFIVLSFQRLQNVLVSSLLWSKAHKLLNPQLILGKLLCARAIDRAGNLLSVAMLASHDAVDVNELQHVHVPQISTRRFCITDIQRRSANDFAFGDDSACLAFRISCSLKQVRSLKHLLLNSLLTVTFELCWCSTNLMVHTGVIFWSALFKVSTFSFL